MVEDPVGRVFLVLGVLVGLLVAVKPGWFVWISSYGRKGIGDVDARSLQIVRIVAAIVVAWGSIALIAWAIVSLSKKQ